MIGMFLRCNDLGVFWVVPQLVQQRRFDPLLFARVCA